MTEVVHLSLADDGDIPNNAALPLILYRGALDTGGDDPDGAFEALFASNGWGYGWRGGVIYPFHHFHAEAHEVVGIARGQASVQFGGPKGPVLDVAAGDAVLIPAGVGHCRIDDAPGLSVVGSYPPGQRPDLRRQGESDGPALRRRIAGVPLPERDPVVGAEGPAIRLWGASSRQA